MHFSSPKKLTTFLVVVIVTLKPLHNVVKIWQLIGGLLVAGTPSHGTTGTMDNPALVIVYIIVYQLVHSTQFVKHHSLLKINT